jgi:sulfoxide reductase catalytic subunit YedY
MTGAGLLAAPLTACAEAAEKPAATAKALPAAKGGLRKGFPAPRNKDFSPDWRLTSEKVMLSYNNYFEFSTDKERPSLLTDRFKIEPWPVQVYGLCEKPFTLDAKELEELFGLEERVYRFRCVEAWSAVVPWTGFELRKLVERAAPKPEAKFLRFETATRPDEYPSWHRLLNQGYPLPYNEGMRLDEAMHPLALVVTGLYGKPLAKQNGAPIRIVVPWKYGYKSIKSIVKIEFTAKQPVGLWEALQPNEYPFLSNVDPDVPHPRWSQAVERVVDTGDRIRTLKYNGYGDLVAGLYKKG